MADKTGIGWTQATWNPVVGCSIVSPGCTNCYAMKQAFRIERMAAGAGKATHYAGTTKETKAGAVWTGKMVVSPPHIFEQPLRWSAPRVIFVNSMSDLFHEDVADETIDRVFAVMALASHHTFQILTKRSAVMRHYLSGSWRDRVGDILAGGLGGPMRNGNRYSAIRALETVGVLPNVWLGVSAEDQKRADERIDDLLATPAAVRFVSYEPALGPINFAPFMWPVHASWPAGFESAADALAAGAGSNVRWKRQALVAASSVFLDWIIIGGESGPGCRPFNVRWAEDVVLSAQRAGTAVFMKQLGSNPVADGEHGLLPVKLSHRKGEDMADWPTSIRVQEYPKGMAA